MNQGLPNEFILEALHSGEVELQGQFILGSNATLLVRVAYQGEEFIAVYKPERGERPLWDFPYGSLEKREAAAYVVSEALGWNLVPPVVHREDGPFGPGSFQVFVEHDPDYHYFNFSTEDIARLRPVVAFDLLINNADRKGGHIIKDDAGHLWLIDHGLCFNVEEKLRTVIWDFAGQLIPSDLRKTMKQFQAKLLPSSKFLNELQNHLDRDEIQALSMRAGHLSEVDTFPFPPNDRRAYPFPPV